MSIDNIIVTTDSFHSQNKHDLVSSNIQYITKLFQKNLKEDKISENALMSYYVDYYHSHITHGGFEGFIQKFDKNFKTLYYIRAGLKALKSHKHLELFNLVFPQNISEKEDHNPYKLNILFKKIQQDEDLVSINHSWLMSHPELLIMHRDAIDNNVQKHLQTHKEDKRHIKIIKQLCQIINEEFIAVTAGDSNNIYNRSWHFKTAQNYYYMIEKNHIVTLYNSFTKKEVTKGKLSANKTEASSISNFISQMLA